MPVVQVLQANGGSSEGLAAKHEMMEGQQGKRSMLRPVKTL